MSFYIFLTVYLHESRKKCLIVDVVNINSNLGDINFHPLNFNSFSHFIELKIKLSTFLLVVSAIRNAYILSMYVKILVRYFHISSLSFMLILSIIKWLFKDLMEDYFNYHEKLKNFPLYLCLSWWSRFYQFIWHL